MLMTVHDVLKVNLKAFKHMLEELGITNYAEFILHPQETRFRLNLACIFMEAFQTAAVLDGGGRPYDKETAKLVLVATALDIPISKLDEVKTVDREQFFVDRWKELKHNYWSSDWYNDQTFALRMRPMLEGSRKSLEGFLLERAVRESLTRVSENLGIKIDPKGDKAKRSKNSTVITLRGNRNTIHVQVKGVTSTRHHPERAKILGKFADDVHQDGDVALPILVGDCTEFYQKIPALNYIRVEPQSVIDMGPGLDKILSEMVCRVL
jgi:hypothetical protein